jgi:hypothetical protein
MLDSIGWTLRCTFKTGKEVVKMQKFGIKILGLLVVLVWVTGCATMNDIVRPKEQGGRTSEVQSVSQTAQTLSPRAGGGDLSLTEVVGDILWVRPMGILQTTLQVPAFVISLPVTIPLKKTEEAKEFLITYPYYYYIKRPLGEM